MVEPECIDKLKKLKKLENDGKKDSWIQVRINQKFKEELVKQLPKGKKLSEFIIDSIFEHLPIVNTPIINNVPKKPKIKTEHPLIPKKKDDIKPKPVFDFFTTCEKCGKFLSECECDKE